MSAVSTPRRVLLDHLRTLHRYSGRGNGVKTEVLQKLHRHQHHHRWLRHYHAGVNLGPDQRPVGWTTGEDAVLKDRAKV